MNKLIKTLWKSEESLNLTLQTGVILWVILSILLIVGTLVGWDCSQPFGVK